MAITTQEEKKNKIFTPTFKRNWKLFKQSTMGKVGLIIISFFWNTCDNTTIIFYQRILV